MPMQPANSSEDFVERARTLATQAHQRIDHRRKYSQQPYDMHLRAVAELVATVSGDPEMLAAAWLHDIVEDTPVTLEEVEREFGPGVTGLVRELTDVSRPGDGNRAARKALDRQHLAQASPRAKTIKLADLCDNAGDIAGADPRFARVFLREMAALLEVLGEGDVRMLARARRVHARCEAQLRAEDAEPAESPALAEWRADQVRIIRRQMRAFSVRDLASPLPSVDAERPAPDTARLAAAQGWTVLGLRHAGHVDAYARPQDLIDGSCAEAGRVILPEQLVDSAAPLSVMVHVLTRHEFAFVRLLGQVGGVLVRDDLHKPIGRMWLFGMVTLAELMITERVRQRWPRGAWRAELSAGRLDKALELQRERARRGQSAGLLECLQLSDKLAILVRDPEQLAAFGYRSKRAAEADLRELESLRNHLAHSQDFVASHWQQIARMTRRFEEALMEEGGMPSPPAGG
jgi:hypothetical protein